MRRKLLLADDSVTIQRVVELTFSGEQIDVVAVSDGEQAIARIPAEQPDIILADIAMPKKNGYDVAAFVKQHPSLSHIPVLLLAGAFEPVDEERARLVKCDGVLVKPFETHDVIARVRELIEGGSAADSPSNVTAFPDRGVPTEALADEEIGPQQQDESLDEYFDRLDMAFATRSTAAPAPPAENADDGSGRTGFPTIDTLIGNIAPLNPAEPPRPFPHLPPPGPSPQATTPSATAPDAEDGNLLADLFHLLLEVEQGERDAGSIRTPDEIERIRRRNTIE